MIDFNWPIEWDDGEAAWLNEPATEDGATVYSTREPAGWQRSFMPRLSARAGVTVDIRGEMLCAAGRPGMPHLVNTEMPILRFSDGSAPVSGRITDDGACLRLIDNQGVEQRYIWPTLKPWDKKARKLREVTAAQIAKEEEKAAEVAVMEESPFYGMF